MESPFKLLPVRSTIYTLNPMIGASLDINSLSLLTSSPIAVYSTKSTVLGTVFIASPLLAPLELPPFLFCW